MEAEIYLCKFPPNPNAICRFEKCLGKPKIYLTDPDFKASQRLSVFFKFQIKKENNFILYVLVPLGLYSDMLLSEVCGRIPYDMLEVL